MKTFSINQFKHLALLLGICFLLITSCDEKSMELYVRPESASMLNLSQGAMMAEQVDIEGYKGLPAEASVAQLSKLAKILQKDKYVKLLTEELPTATIDLFFIVDKVVYGLSLQDENPQLTVLKGTASALGTRKKITPDGLEAIIEVFDMPRPSIDGKLTLLKVLSANRIAVEQQMADMPYVDGYEVERLQVDLSKDDGGLRSLIDNSANYIDPTIIIQCTSKPEYYVYWANDRDTLYGINISSECPMLFVLQYDGPDAKVIETKHIEPNVQKKFANALIRLQ